MNRSGLHTIRAFAAVAFLGSTFALVGILLNYYLPDERKGRRQTSRIRINTEDSSDVRLETGGLSEPYETHYGIRPMTRGIESCIGNTPLFRIKSLSDATGCEILGKAEVWMEAHTKLLYNRVI